MVIIIYAYLFVKTLTFRTEGKIPCHEELREVIKLEREKEELKDQKEREDRDRQVAHAEWVDGNLSPKVNLVSSIDEAMANAPKIDLASLAEEARKEGKKSSEVFITFYR